MLGYFLPTIISTLGFKGYLGQLLTVPPNVFALIIIIGNCLHSDHTKERTKHVIAGLIFVSTGYLLLAVVTNWRVRFFATFLIACTNAAVLPFLAHRTATVSGSTATALATGGIIALANCGGISAPFLFPATDGPLYPMGNVSVSITNNADSILHDFTVDRLCDASIYDFHSCVPRMETRHWIRIP